MEYKVEYKGYTIEYNGCVEAYMIVNCPVQFTSIGEAKEYIDGGMV